MAAVIDPAGQSDFLTRERTELMDCRFHNTLKYEWLYSFICITGLFVPPMGPKINMKLGFFNMNISVELALF